MLKEKGKGVVMSNEIGQDKQRDVDKDVQNMNVETPKRGNPQHMVKSPSESTLYQPIFSKRVIQETSPEQSHDLQVTVNPNNIDFMGMAHKNLGNHEEMSPPQDSMIDHISQFVEAIRMESVGANGEDGDRIQNQVRSEIHILQAERAKSDAERAIIEAEKFHARIETLKQGMPLQFVSRGDGFQIVQDLQGEPPHLTDDNFFHLTCHIEDSLKEKMEQGRFVDLEKLLPKGGRSNDRLEWVHHEGATFLAPVAQWDTKIHNMCKWDQAFRIYATFYCGANPNRAKEIWQYVDVIHTAASAYNWENVYNYDVTFQHLMEFNPARSWAVTYTHMWNLSLKEPLTKNWYNKNNFGSAGLAQQGQFVQNNSPIEKRAVQSGALVKKKPRYCWSFNKGEKCKCGAHCHFIERCSYCDLGSHPLVDCPEAKNKNNKNGQASGQTQSAPVGGED